MSPKQPFEHRLTSKEANDLIYELLSDSQDTTQISPIERKRAPTLPAGVLGKIAAWTGYQLDLIITGHNPDPFLKH